MDSAYFRFVVKCYVDSLENNLDLKRVVVAGNAVGSRQMLFSFTPQQWESAIQNEVHSRLSPRLMINIDSNYVLTCHFR